MTPSTPFLHVHVSSSHLHLLLTSMHHTSRATHLHLNLASVAASSTHVDLTSMASSLDHLYLSAVSTSLDHLDLPPWWTVRPPDCRVMVVVVSTTSSYLSPDC